MARPALRSAVTLLAPRPAPPLPALPRSQVLCDFLRSIIALTPEDLVRTVYLCCNRLAPAYANLELGIGDSILIKAVSAATGRTAADVKAAARKSGDLGLVAEASRGKQSTLMKPKPLTVRGVFREPGPAVPLSPPPAHTRAVRPRARCLWADSGL